MMKWTRATAALLVVATTVTTQAQVRDRVVESKGTPISGEITAMTKTELSIESAGATRKLPVNELRLVQFADEPAELRRVRDSLRNNNIVAARSEIMKIAQTKSTKAFVQQDILFYVAYCNVRVAMTGKGDKRAAGGQLAQFVMDYPNSYHYYQAVETLGDLAISLGQYDVAANFYGKMAQAPWPMFQMRAEVLAARALLVGKKYTDALRLYDKVAAKPLESIEAQQQKLLAKVGRAACLGHTGKAPEGLKIALDIIAKEDSQRDKVLFARAYNAAGACYLQLGKPKDALMAYLHTDVLFNQDPDAHAESLYHLAKLWTQVSKSDRANRARGLLKERYAGSSWATQK